MEVDIGTLEKVDLRTQWTDEARDFTPWLVENINRLSDVLEVELEVEEVEKSIGSFNVDILAKDINTDRYIIVENQLDKTNHDHLGKIITYSAGVDAFMVIWISEKVAEEHRKAIDWLNETAGEKVNFFALEIQLWKISDSPVAPKFEVVSSPNEWSKTVQSTTRKLTETKKIQREFWQELRDFMKNENTFLNLRKPQPHHWYSIAVGKSGYKISLTVNTKENRVGCELYISSDEDSSKIKNLYENRDSIEEKINTSDLEWQELPNKKASRIVQYKPGDILNRDEWPELFEWLSGRAESFYTVFSPLVQEL